MSEREVLDVMTAVARAVEVMLREVKDLRDDVRDLHADIVQRDDVRHLARRVATADQLDAVADQLATLVSELQRARAHVVPAELPAPAASVSAEVALRVRKMSDAARHLGTGVLDDLRRRRGAR